MLISASFQSHRRSQRGHTQTPSCPSETACVTNIWIFITPHLRVTCRASRQTLKDIIYGLHIDHLWSNKLARVNLRKGMGRDDGDASMNIEWRHLLPQWSGQARAVITPVSLQITPHLPNSDKFNSNPSLKCSPTQTGGEKSASAAYRKSLD